MYYGLPCQSFLKSSIRRFNCFLSSTCLEKTYTQLISWPLTHDLFVHDVLEHFACNASEQDWPVVGWAVLIPFLKTATIFAHLQSCGVMHVATEFEISKLVHRGNNFCIIGNSRLGSLCEVDFPWMPMISHNALVEKTWLLRARTFDDGEVKHGSIVMFGRVLTWTRVKKPHAWPFRILVGMRSGPKVLFTFKLDMSLKPLSWRLQYLP